MNDWLTLPIRLAVVAVLGVCLWVVMSTASHQVLASFGPPESTEQQAEEAHSEIPAAHAASSWLDAGRVLPMAIVFAISFFIFHEWICYRLFVEAYRQVVKCGGVARTATKVDWLWLHYLYCKTEVEICHAEIAEGQFPLLSQIPRLSLVRLWHVNLLGSESEAAIKQLAQCPDLQRLDISCTALSAIDLGQAGLLEMVPQVILN